MKRITLFFIAAAVLFQLNGCSLFYPQFVIISGSENESLEPILKKFGRRNRVNIEMHYKGSVDIMLELQKGTLEADAIWPANSLWISMGDKDRKIKHIKSIMTSPVVFGIRKSKAQDLGLVGKKVKVADILDLIKQKRLSFMMTSATQSNSGASGFLGFCYALAGNPEVLTQKHLDDQELRSELSQLLAGINRSSGSSGWLKELFLEGNYDAMVNYEAMIIEANNHLISEGKEPLYCVYPEDGIVLSDSPLGYVNRGDKKKEEIFLKMQEFLLSDDIQGQILDMGRRTGFGGLAGDADNTVFNPDWGIDYSRVLSPIKLPNGETIRYALNLYQTELRKPSFTVFCLDYSGSMTGSGERSMKEAMELLLDQNRAEEYMINMGKDDITVVYPFSSEILGGWKALGNGPETQALLSQIQSFAPNGSTDIYSPTIAALQLISSIDRDKYMPAVILMTDGISNTGRSYSDVQAAYEQFNMDIPIFSIMFGDADEEQLHDLAELSRGRVFDGRHDLLKAFRKAKGYN